MAGQREPTVEDAAELGKKPPVRLAVWKIAEKVYSALVDPMRQNRVVAALLTAYVLIWTMYGIVAKSNQDIHPDTGELLAWSRELAFGYWKHPPFGVYVVKAWTTLFPVEDWSIYLLAQINAALALWIAWLLLSSLLDAQKRVLGLMLLTFVPFYNFLSLKYDHNSILLPLWAATTFFFIRSFETRHIGIAAAAGLAAGLAMLGKYWTVMLLAGLVAGALIDPRRRAYFLSPAPWVSTLVGAIVLLPHGMWLFDNHFVPFEYAAAEHQAGSRFSSVVSSARYLVAGVLYCAVPVSIVAFVARPSRAAILDMAFPRMPTGRLVAVIFWVPLLLPTLLAILLKRELISLWMLPAMTLLPAILLRSRELHFSREALVKVIGFALAFPVLALLFAPLVSLQGYVRPNPNGTSYYRLLSAAAQQLWHDRTGQPLKVVVGDRKLAIGIAFYSPDQPLANPVDLKSGIALDTASVWREGAIAVCRGTIPECAWLMQVTPSAAHEPVHEVTLSRRVLGWTGPPATFSVLLLPPES